MLREAVVIGLLGAAGWWAASSFGGSYSRVVDRSPSDVASALSDLDIRDQPGAPGTDPTASGGILPTFTVESSPGSVTWFVMSGDKVATRMIAHLEPVDGGAKTKVTAEVVRGDAPDDFVSPAFRSKSVTMGLFSAALEDELDELVFKIGAWGPHCDAIMAKFEQRNAANTDQHNPGSMGQAIAGTSKAVMSIAAMDKELKAAGCPQNSSNANYEPALGMSGPVERLPSSAETAPNIRPEDAAKPTTDLSRYR